MSLFFTNSVCGYDTELFGLTVIYRVALSTYTLKKDAYLGVY